MSNTDNGQPNLSANRSPDGQMLPRNASFTQPNVGQPPSQNNQPNRPSAEKPNSENVRSNRLKSSGQSPYEKHTPCDRLLAKQTSSDAASLLAEQLYQQQQSLIALKVYEGLQHDLRTALDEIKQQQFLLYQQLPPFSDLTLDEMVGHHTKRNFNPQEKPAIKVSVKKQPQQPLNRSAPPIMPFQPLQQRLAQQDPNASNPQIVHARQTHQQQKPWYYYAVLVFSWLFYFAMAFPCLIIICDKISKEL